MKLESLSCAQTRAGCFWIARASVLVLTACGGCDSFGDSPITPDPEASPTFGGDAFLAEVLVIDGELNYFSPSSEVGQPSFESDEKGLTVEQAFGVDIGLDRSAPARTTSSPGTGPISRMARTRAH